MTFSTGLTSLRTSSAAYAYNADLAIKEESPVVWRSMAVYYTPVKPFVRIGEG